MSESLTNKVLELVSYLIVHSSNIYIVFYVLTLRITFGLSHSHVEIDDIRSRGRPWRYSVITNTPDFPTEYQIRRHSNPTGLPIFAAIWGPDFRASIIRLTCPHVFKQIKNI